MVYWGSFFLGMAAMVMLSVGVIAVLAGLALRTLPREGKVIPFRKRAHSA